MNKFFDGFEKRAFMAVPIQYTTHTAGFPLHSDAAKKEYSRETTNRYTRDGAGLGAVGGGGLGAIGGFIRADVLANRRGQFMATPKASNRAALGGAALGALGGGLLGAVIGRHVSKKVIKGDLAAGHGFGPKRTYIRDARDDFLKYRKLNNE